MAVQDRVIITCAVTGASPAPNHPDFPKSNEAVANAALEAGEAGAAIIHIHVRKPDGTPSTDLDDYTEVVGRIRQKNNDLILNLTTGPGCGWLQSDEDPALPAPGTNMMTADRRTEHIQVLRPELATLDICTMQLNGAVAINTKKMMHQMTAIFRDCGTMPEIECFDTGDLVFAEDLIAEGAIDGPGMYSIVMGTKYGIHATPEAMIYCRDHLPRGAVWQGFGISRHTWPMAAQSIILGGNVRTGFEDSTYLGKGRQARSNADMVVQAVELVERLGSRPATPGEARQTLGLPN
ncbi:MAG: 3-keto-5-aminohexanoate cleavage protein [Caulobacteraceae bacterium]